jgi:hypothetical protein
MNAEHLLGTAEMARTNDVRRHEQEAMAARCARFLTAETCMDCFVRSSKSQYRASASAYMPPSRSSRMLRTCGLELAFLCSSKRASLLAKPASRLYVRCSRGRWISHSSVNNGGFMALIGSLLPRLVMHQYVSSSPSLNFTMRSRASIVRVCSSA